MFIGILEPTLDKYLFQLLPRIKDKNYKKYPIKKVYFGKLFLDLFTFVESVVSYI